MKYGISKLSVVPCRAEPSDKSEMVNQLLFGDIYKVIEIKSAWVKIRTAFDNYEAWIDKKQYFEISEKDYEKFSTVRKFYTNFDLVAAAQNQLSEEFIPIVMGSTLPAYSKGICKIAKDFQLEFKGDARTAKSKVDRNILIENAKMYLNAPYLWGGKSPFGIDCSGFTQIVYKMAGLHIPRDASQQALKGRTLSFLEEALPGDLAFFDNQEGQIIHVGILLSPQAIIHASGKVRIDGIDHQGIFNRDTRSYSHKLRIIKQLID